MRKVEKPWGYEEIWSETDKYVGKRLVILPGHRLSLQYHEKKEETVYVMEGRLRVWESEDDRSFKDLGMGSVYHVNPGQVHRFGSPSGVLTVLIEVSTPEIEDVVRISDDYKR
jgi:mannose-6-phosphate isomerase